MKKKFRTYTIYKIVGGVITVFSLTGVILILMRDMPPGGGPPLPLTAAILPGLLSILGIYIFIVNDGKIKQDKKINDLLGKIAKKMQNEKRNPKNGK